MKTAVLISGQMRTFARCYPTQRWQVYRHYHATMENELSKSLGEHYEKHNAPPRAINFVTGQLQPEPHFFVSCADDENADSTELLRQHYANVHIEKWTDPTDLPEIPIEHGAYAPYANAAGHRQLMLQHWGNGRVWQFFREITESPSEFNTAYRTIIRIRPDQFVHRFQKPPAPRANECYCPWWGKFGGVNDRMAIMGSDAGLWYFGVLGIIDELLASGCPFHPETLVAASLNRGSVSIRNTLLASFSTLRMTGQQRWPEVTSDDLAELIANSRDSRVKNV